MYQKIMVPLDGSEFSECSLEHAKEIALGCKAPEVILLRVARPIPADITDVLIERVEVPKDWPRKTEKENQAEAEKYLSNMAKKMQDEGISARAVTVKGEPANEILSYAEKNKVDLIIMSTHGQSGLGRWWFGNVADRVVRHSTIPVLIVSPPGCRKSS
jgi:nucleotide-binding universal stress UspA family protein